MRKISPLLSLTVVAILGIGIATVSARTWTQAASGKKIEADFVRLDGDQVVLSVGGQLAQVPLDQLSAEDQAFVKESLSSGGSGEAASSGDWPHWRGTDFSGISPDTGVKGTWPEGGPEQLWVFSDAGMGYSSYSIVGDQLFTLGTRGDELFVIAVNIADGTEAWSSQIGGDDQQGYNAGWGHGPRSTPTFSDGHLYVLGPKGTVACVSAEDGSVKWEKNLVSDFGGKAGGWGFSESPLVDGDKVIVAPGGGDSPIVALNKQTGATEWTSSGFTAGKAEYASIVPTEMNGIRQYIKLFDTQLVSVAAEDGKLIWKSDWPGKTAVIPTPIVDGNEVYITSGYGVGCKLVRVGSDNSVEDVWVNKEMKNHHGGVVKIGDHIYGFSDGGGLICQDWATGEMVWNEKGEGKLIKGAVHAVEGNLVCLNEGDGAVTLAKATPDGFEQLGQFTLSPQSENRSPKGKVWTHPVVVGGKLYLRDQENIVCYDVKG